MAVSGSGSDSRSRAWMNDAQMQQLQNLWAQGGNLNVWQQGSDAMQNVQDLAPQLQGQMQGMLGDLGATSAGTSQAMQGLGAMGQVGGGNPYLQQNLDALGAGINRQMENYIMPGIAQGAVQSGGFGGGRQGVAQGLAVQGAQDAFQQGASNLLNQSAQQSLQANTAMGGLQTQAGMAGLQGAGSIFQMGLNPMIAQWLPMQMQRGLIGQNIMHSDASSDSDAFGIGIGGT